MAESVQVRCPECLRTLRYAAPAFPCSCGTPVAPPVVPGAAAVPVTHRNWSDEWVTVHCPACARASDWPHPEVGCPCGAVLRVAVRGADEPVGAGTGTPEAGGGTAPRVVRQRPATDLAAGPATDPTTDPATAPSTEPTTGLAAGPRGPATGPTAGPTTGPTVGPAAGARPGSGPAPASPGESDHGAGPAPGPDSAPYTSFARRHPAHALPDRAAAPASGPAPDRSPFRPVTIRTARDAVAASAGYLRWLGFRDVVQPEERSASAVDLRGPGLVAQVDPSTRPTGLRAVECLWLNGLSSSAVGVYFSLAGYTPEAHERAEGLGIPLFVLDLTGTPQPVNSSAADLLATGAP
ncbi:hypothetical protein ACIGO8_09670 [Streptomyces sp. NPDC053493]|uniref:hypothetical protein n=1 Tax=Streptomyces sp. NPDC053493 TaxID=3365705 RepID=UPI0037D22935